MKEGDKIASEFDEKKDLIFNSAEAIHIALSSLSPFSNGRLNFAVSVAKKGVSEITSHSIGEENKIFEGISHGDAFLKRDSLETPLEKSSEEEHNVIIAGDLVISVYGSIEQMNLPIAIGIARRAGLKNYVEAENLARELQCIEMYAQYENALTGL